MTSQKEAFEKLRDGYGYVSDQDRKPTPSQSIDERKEFEDWLEDFKAQHEEWQYADSEAMYFAAWQAAQADLAATIEQLQLENAKFRDVLEFYKCFSDSRISSIAQTALLNITTAKAQVETEEARDLAEYERLKAKYDHEN